MCIGRIEAVEKRHALVPVAQKRQAHMPQLVFPGLRMSVAAKLRFCLPTHLSEIIRCIIKQTIQGNIISLNHPLCDLIAYGFDLISFP